MNLDNQKEAQPTVQVPREITTTNGCKVTLTFAVKEDPNLQHDVAEISSELTSSSKIIIPLNVLHFEGRFFIPMKTFAGHACTAGERLLY